MSTLAAEPQFNPFRELARFWWLELVTGILWVVIALSILQFDEASVTTVGVLIGIMLVLAGFQQIVIGMFAERLRWLFFIFAGLFIIGGILCFIEPKSTVAGVADILGFIFLTVGVFWLIQAFVEKPVNPVWWLGLVSGILMVILAFWTSGQFQFHKVYILLVFAGIWALMHGITDIVRAFQLRSLRDA